MKKTLILASKSPRRLDILRAVGVTPTVVSPDTDEDGERDAAHPEQLVLTLAARKLSAAAACLSDMQKENALVLSADTVVACDGVILEKPADEADAHRMLSKLSGRAHNVYTGFAMLYDGKTVCDYQKTDVYFRTLSDAEIDAYIKTGEPMDKAGAYGAQKRGALFVEKLDGDYFNVVGLPAEKINETMKTAFGLTFADFQ